MNYRNIFSALIAFTILVVLSSPQLEAQRIYDEFDAPVINSGKLYMDYSTSPVSFSDRYIGPSLVNNSPYLENTNSSRVIIPVTAADYDAGMFPVVLPFTIQYNGTTYPANSSLWVSVNGFVQVGSVSNPYPSYSGNNSADMFSANTSLPANIIAPYWGNHSYQTSVVGKESELSWQVYDALPKRRIVIQWKNLSVNIKGIPSDLTSLANFQLILWERQVPTSFDALPGSVNTQNDIDFSYGNFGGNGSVDPSYYNGASVGLKGSNGIYMNGLTYNNPALAKTSTIQTSFWTPSGSTSSKIRFETYQRSLAINPRYFESKLVPFVGVPPLRTDRDDGYYRVDLSALNFNFNFQGLKQPSLWINVNGFVSFQSPDQSSIANDQATGMFTYSSSYPNNVVAPFWGDHYLRNPGELAVPSANGQYLASEISYIVLGSYPTRRLVVQWKNLNIMDETLPSSTGNFQAIFYEGVDDRYPDNFAGGIEFAYGDVGNNPGTTLTTVSYKNASVGLKGSANGLSTTKSDFINGLTYDNIAISFTSEQLTQGWRPSGGSNSGEGRRIFFRSIPRFLTPNWGDGDADLSQIRTRKHAGMIQNRFVTVNDARLVLRWLVQDKSLSDSLRKDTLRLGNNYHADVNHNGRYYYSSRTYDNLKDTIQYKRTIDVDTFGVRVRRDSAESLAGLPPDAGPLRLIYYEANGQDAAWILRYIAGGISSLPWIIDTLTVKGKATIEQKYADNIDFNSVCKISDNTYKIPMYINGISNQPLSIDFTVDGTILDVQPVQSQDNQIISSFNDNKVVIAANGKFDQSTPIAYLIIRTDNDKIQTSKIEFNENIRSPKSMILENSDLLTSVINVAPNPLINSASIVLNLPSSGQYTVQISDLLGNTIKSYPKSNFNKGLQSIEFQAVDENNNVLPTGLYIVKIVGEELSAVSKFQIIR